MLAIFQHHFIENSKKDNAKNKKGEVGEHGGQRLTKLMYQESIFSGYFAQHTL